ncbi:unnamed protein product, partial [Pleuronectes platessa]
MVASCDSRTERDNSDMGRGPARSPGQTKMETDPQHQAPSILGSKSLESHYLMIIGNKYYGWFIPLQSVRGMASYN